MQRTRKRHFYIFCVFCNSKFIAFSSPPLTYFFLCLFVILIIASFLLCCSAYGEAIFLVIQTAIIAFLVLTYTRGTASGALYTAVYAAILSFLLSPMAPMMLLWALQTSVILLVVTARVSDL